MSLLRGLVGRNVHTEHNSKSRGKERKKERKEKKKKREDNSNSKQLYKKIKICVVETSFLHTRLFLY